MRRIIGAAVLVCSLRRWSHAPLPADTRPATSRVAHARPISTPGYTDAGGTRSASTSRFLTQARRRAMAGRRAPGTIRTFSRPRERWRRAAVRERRCQRLGGRATRFAFHPQWPSVHEVLVTRATSSAAIRRRRIAPTGPSVHLGGRVRFHNSNGTRSTAGPTRSCASASRTATTTAATSSSASTACCTSVSATAAPATIRAARARTSARCSARSCGSTSRRVPARTTSRPTIRSSG
jgi:hypothetical protein